MARLKTNTKTKAKSKNIEPRRLFFFVAFPLLGLAFVFFRMQGIEQQISLNKWKDKLKHEQMLSKELKAEQADILSIRSLRDWATKYQLNEPSSKQVIVVKE